MSYAQRLISAIKSKPGMDQSKLAREIGVKPQAVQYLCTPKATGSKHTAAIARALGVNPQWLETGQGEMFNKEEEQGVKEERANYSTDEVELVEQYRNLSAEDQARLRSITKALTSDMDKKTG